MKKIFKWYKDELAFAYISITCIIGLYINISYCEYSNTIYWPIYLLSPIVIFVIALILQITSLIICRKFKI